MHPPEGNVLNQHLHPGMNCTSSLQKHPHLQPDSSSTWYITLQHFPLMATRGTAILADFLKLWEQLQMHSDKQKNTKLHPFSSMSWFWKSLIVRVLQVFFLKSTRVTFVVESAADASGDCGISLTDC